MQAIALDNTNQTILNTRAAARDAISGPRIGDFIEFACGTVRRVAYDWDGSLQTSDDGRYYLGSSYLSHSGSLHLAIDTDLLTSTNESREGSCWFFNHDLRRAHNALDATIACRVYRASCVAPA